MLDYTVFAARLRLSGWQIYLCVPYYSRCGRCVSLNDPGVSGRRGLGARPLTASKGTMHRCTPSLGRPGPPKSQKQQTLSPSRPGRTRYFLARSLVSLSLSRDGRVISWPLSLAGTDALSLGYTRIYRRRLA